MHESNVASRLLQNGESNLTASSSGEVKAFVMKASFSAPSLVSACKLRIIEKRGNETAASHENGRPRRWIPV